MTPIPHQCGTVKSVLKHARCELEEPRDAEIILADSLGVNRAWLYAHPEYRLKHTEARVVALRVNKRKAGHPMAYILGWREFYGLRLGVSPAVLIPRPDTELIVDIALHQIPANQSVSILEIGTGSGAIALALAIKRPKCLITATDISPRCVEIAKANAKQLNLKKIEFLEGDLFTPIGKSQFDLIISNPPYVADFDTHLQQGDLRFEPKTALLGGADGLTVLRHLIASAPSHLREGGQLLLEHGYNQRAAVAALCYRNGFHHVSVFQDTGNRPRCILAKR